MLRNYRIASRFLFILIVAAGSALAAGCGRFASVFYNQKEPQALQRDTITASGQVKTTIDPPEFKKNGVIKLAPVESLGAMDSIAVQVPTEVKAIVGTFENDRKLYAPRGFRAEVVAWELGKPHDIEIREDGTLFVSDIDGGKIYAVSPTGNKTVIAQGLSSPHGIDYAEGSLYYSDETHVYRFNFSSPTSLEGSAEMLTDKVVRGGEFYTRTIRYSPNDERVYISVGATNANGEESDKEHATVFRMRKEGERPVRASFGGLRNTMGMDVHPETGDMWGIDQGIDDLSEQLAPEEINIIKIGKNYGHPYYYSQNIRNPKFEDVAGAALPRDPVPPVIELQPYSEPTDLQFYTGSAMGPEWKNSMLIVFRGYVLNAMSRPKELRTGFKVIRVRADSDGSNARQADFISGWLTGAGDFWGRPNGVAIAPNGKTFYVTDDQNGVVYKFTAP